MPSRTTIGNRVSRCDEQQLQISAALTEEPAVNRRIAIEDMLCQKREVKRGVHHSEICIIWTWFEAKTAAATVENRDDVEHS